MSRIVVLGPQQPSPTVGATLDDLGIRGPVATVTAGWQEWESEDEALDAELGGRSVNLGLYARAERVWTADPELRAAHQAVQERLRGLRRIYNRRLAPLAVAWIDVLEADGPPELLDPERAHALELIRALDAHHLDRIAALRADFEAEMEPLSRPAVTRERTELRRVLADSEALVIEGGHVALLHNRLRLFGLTELVGDRPVIACSGGAMALAERVVLFHDAPPWGPGNTEVALTGIGAHRGLVPLPHARTRLRLDDRARVARLATRLAPAHCVVLEPGTRIDWDGTRWQPTRVERLDADGSVRPWKAAA